MVAPPVSDIPVPALVFAYLTDGGTGGALLAGADPEPDPEPDPEVPLVENL